ncbi:FixH family protein [Lentzea californiensis]|uniref:FixH family protein n=1 Tax=Lentzea californiensis TaxID=438851 RepID=UPI00216649A4|nr:FixH family protein [Lentzea californiensis]MCR3750049.1 YtkA-like [Lentzea californiensis]
MKRSAVAVVAGVIALVAAVVVLWPRGVEAQPHLAESARLRFELTPASTRSGSNSFDLLVTDRSGNAADGEVTVEPAMPQMGHALAPITAAPRAPGRYEVAGVDLFMAGQWEITLSLRGERVVIPLLLT